LQDGTGIHSGIAELGSVLPVRRYEPVGDGVGAGGLLLEYRHV
jgi:hypothetical protein